MECYSSHHSESLEELLEWPYRRFIKAFDAWQRRNAVDEIEKRKNMHVAALYANTNFDDERNDREKHIENLERYYEMLKDMVWDQSGMEKENEEMSVLEASDPFLAAGKRNLLKNLPPQMPFENVEEIPD